MWSTDDKLSGLLKNMAWSVTAMFRSAQLGPMALSTFRHHNPTFTNPSKGMRSGSVTTCPLLFPWCPPAAVAAPAPAATTMLTPQIRSLLEVEGCCYPPVSHKTLGAREQSVSVAALRSKRVGKHCRDLVPQEVVLPGHAQGTCLHLSTVTKAVTRDSSRVGTKRSVPA